MLESQNQANWTYSQNVILQHFQESAVEFVWEDQSRLTLSIFAECIILQCILLNFNSTKLEKTFNNTRIWIPNSEKAYGFFLNTNARVITNQKLISQRNILFISDSIFSFTSKSSRTFQEVILNWYEFKPIKIPTAILFGISNTTFLYSNPRERLVLSLLTPIPFLIVDIDKNTLGIGCFLCDKSFSYEPEEWKSISAYSNQNLKTNGINYEPLPENFMRSFKNLTAYWKKLHSNQLYYAPPHPQQSCTTILSRYNRNPPFPKETCGVFEAYFETVNCSCFFPCLYTHTIFFNLSINSPHKITLQGRLGARTTDGVPFLHQTFPFIQHQTDFTLKNFTEKIHFLDANLTALLAPFYLNCWLCILISIIVISLWLIWVEDEKFKIVLFWQFSVAMEQEGDNHWRSKLRGKTIITMWIFSAILLRQFYNSSLYSFMTAAPKPTDLPGTLKEVVDRNDFDLILPESYKNNEMQTILHLHLAEEPLHSKMHQIYHRILIKHFFLKSGQEIRTLVNISGGNLAMVGQWKYVPVYTQGGTTPHYIGGPVPRKLNRFAIICEGECDSNWNAVLVGESNSKLEKFTPEDQNDFIYRAFGFWTIRAPNYATVNFFDFLGIFVHSGLYENPVCHENSCQAIPTAWLTNNNKSCLYPRLPTFKLTDAVKKRITPAESWDTFDVRILTFTDTYEKARRKAARAELTSHLESDDQDDSRLRKRRARETTVTFNDTSSEEGAFIPANEKIRKPKPKRRKNLKQKQLFFGSSLNLQPPISAGPSFPSPNFCLAPGSGTQRIEDTKLDDFNNQERVEVSEDELSFAPLNADSIDSSIDEPLHFNALPEARAATTTTTDALSLGLTVFQKTVLRALSVIQEDIKQLHALQKNSSDIERPSESTLTVTLPLCSVTDFYTLNDWLAITENAHILCLQLKVAGGENIKSLTGNILSRLLGPGLCENLNFTGKFQKCKLKDSNTHSAIIGKA
ncbi:unnamed protein product [Orchesella dallaii]|uniref:Uncharacterized protein n=1 Tax=Orchesella dallaii TaxID=48710 RepID=A0ABP1R0H0_9HEXA